MICFKQGYDDNAGIQINVMPLVDVIFILLIFFLLTASKSKGIVLDLPDAATGEAVPSQSWEVAITKDEQLLFNGVPVEKSKLGAVLNTAREQAPTLEIVVLKAHREASVGTFVNVMDTVRSTGFYNLVIATDSKRITNEYDKRASDN